MSITRPTMSREQQARFDAWVKDASTTNLAFTETVVAKILPDKLANEFVTPQDIDDYLQQLENALAAMRSASSWR